jgi:predicted Zn finger-like uncharacterized protein
VLTRCPSCATHFRVTPEQLKARGGRVRCGQCQKVFNALDSLIEEPVVVTVPVAAIAVPPAPTSEESPAPPTAGARLSAGEQAPETVRAESRRDEIAASPLPPFEAQPEPAETPATTVRQVGEAPLPEGGEAPLPEVSETTPPAPTEADVPGAEPLSDAAATAAGMGAPATPEDWNAGFPESPPPPRRWPWLIGSLVALAALTLQALLAFRVELAVLWPPGKPALLALCEIAGCEVGLPAKVGLVGIEASDLHPDSEHKGRLALAATLKNRAPFAQQFPHLELTLTDTADQAIVRKVLAPADYLPPGTPVAGGMRPNADIMVALGIDPGAIAASGYRLYLFYP